MRQGGLLLASCLLLGCGAEGAPADETSAAIAEARARSAGVDWPSFLGPTGDGKSPETGILTNWPKAGLKILWEKKLGTGYGAPTISGGRALLFDRFGDKARVYALDAETAQEAWRYEYPTGYEDYFGYNNGPRCSPIIDGEHAYAFGADGVLVCLEALTGKLVWTVETAKDFGVAQNFFGVGSNPVVEGDMLLVMVGGSPPGTRDVTVAEGNGSGIVAFDKLTGEVKYKITDELAGYASMKTATIGGRRWGLAFCRGGLVGFAPDSGNVDFHFPWRARTLESVNASMPVVAGNEVFISETYGPGSALLSVAPGKFDVVWQDDERQRDKAMQTHWNTPIEVDGYLYGSSGRHLNNAELRCIEWKTGKVQWSVPGLTRMSLTYIDGHFLCLGEEGRLLLIKANPEKFERLTEMHLVPPILGPRGEGSTAASLGMDPFWAAPVVSHGRLYIRGNGKLACLELIPRE